MCMRDDVTESGFYLLFLVQASSKLWFVLAFVTCFCDLLLFSRCNKIHLIQEPNMLSFYLCTVRYEHETSAELPSSSFSLG